MPLSEMELACIKVQNIFKNLMTGCVEKKKVLKNASYLKNNKHLIPPSKRTLHYKIIVNNNHNSYNNY